MLPKAQVVTLGAIILVCSALDSRIPEPQLMKISNDLKNEINKKVCDNLPIDKLIENDYLTKFTCMIGVQFTDMTGIAQSVKFLEQQCNCLSVKGPMWASCRFTLEGDKVNAACYDTQLESSDIKCNYDGKTLLLNDTVLLGHKSPNFRFTYKVFTNQKLFETIDIVYDATRRLVKSSTLLIDLLGGKVGRINYGIITRKDSDGKVKGKEGITGFMDGASCDGCNGASVITVCTETDNASSSCKPNELWVTFSKDFFEKTKDTEFKDEVEKKLTELGQVSDADGKEKSALDFVKTYTSSSLTGCPKIDEMK